MITIPTLVDSVKTYEGWKMSRLTYYSVVCESPTTGSLQGLRGQRIPFLARGSAGVLYKPIGRAMYFRKPKQIRDLFRAVERQQELYLDLDDIWLPNDFLPSTDALARGAVYRISQDVLRHACSFRLNRITIGTLRKELKKKSAWVRYSKDETAAFGAWSASVIEDAKKYLAKRPEKRLKWKGSKS